MLKISLGKLNRYQAEIFHKLNKLEIYYENRTSILSNI